MIVFVAIVGVVAVLIVIIIDTGDFCWPATDFPSVPH